MSATLVFMKEQFTCDCGGHCGCGRNTAFIGRVLLGLVFLITGLAKLTDFSGTEAAIAGAGFPLPALFTVLAIIFELGGALWLIIGFHARTAAWMLIVFAVIATFAYHNPFTYGVGVSNIMFLKDLAIIGGLLFVTAHGAGACSLTKWNKKICKGGKMCPDCRMEEDSVTM